MPLLAEAQSALRQSLRRLKAPDDPDQLAAYEWVREAAARHRIFLKRFLRADDLADPEGWPDLLARIEALSGGGAQSQRQRMLLDRLRSHVLHAWARARDRGVLAGGHRRPWRRSSARACRRAAGRSGTCSCPVIDDLPDGADLPPGFRLVLREIDRYLATRTPRPVAATAPEPTAEVARGRPAAGRQERRPDRRHPPPGGPAGPEDGPRPGGADLDRDEGAPVDRQVRAGVARPEVALVLLAIRWSSHCFGDVKRLIGVN